MNALAITSEALAETLGAALRPVTVEDICARLPNGHRTLSALENVFRIPADTEINGAIRWLDRLIKSQVDYRQRKHWAYDSLTLKNLADLKVSLGLGLLMRSATSRSQVHL